MDVLADLRRVERRIDGIAGVPTDLPHTFASAVGGALEAAAMVPPAQIGRLIRAGAARWRVDPALVAAIVANESAFDARATSPAGARGLMQLMPGTAASLGVSDVYDPEQNVSGGTRYLRGLLDRFNGDVPKAVAAYNAGPGAVQKYGGIPPFPETQHYVHDVLASYSKYRTRPP
ncbi:MAG TPA: lytic transglycosylase domain-containing protein [Candidatus Lustribacter sp.]